MNEYKFYYHYGEYAVNFPDELYDVNGHKVSKDLYDALYCRALKRYKLTTTQRCYWDNHITKANTFSILTVFNRKDLNND